MFAAPFPLFEPLHPAPVSCAGVREAVILHILGSEPLSKFTSHLPPCAQH